MAVPKIRLVEILKKIQHDTTGLSSINDFNYVGLSRNDLENSNDFSIGIDQTTIQVLVDKMNNSNHSLEYTIYLKYLETTNLLSGSTERDNVSILLERLQNWVSINITGMLTSFDVEDTTVSLTSESEKLRLEYLITMKLSSGYNINNTTTP